MARKDSFRNGSAPVLTVVGTPAEVRAAARAAQAAAEAAAATEPEVRPSVHAESIFHDSRSGRDRREEGPQVNDPRRQNAERRSSKQKSAWWLERDYVESHHFVQKANAATTRLGEDPAIDA